MSASTETGTKRIMAGYLTVYSTKGGFKAVLTNQVNCTNATGYGARIEMAIADAIARAHT